MSTSNQGSKLSTLTASNSLLNSCKDVSVGDLVEICGSFYTRTANDIRILGDYFYLEVPVIGVVTELHGCVGQWWYNSNGLEETILEVTIDFDHGVVYLIDVNYFRRGIIKKVI
jgi:hypothetical protein